MDPRINLVITAAILLPMMGSVIIFTGLTVGLLFARAKIFHYRVYRPMLLNLALAWIPIICVGIALVFLLNVSASNVWVTLLLLFIWFIFFPNSTYLVTEFHHLKEDVNEVPFWFDTIVILSLALCGLMLGSFSLLLVHRMLMLYVPMVYTWIIFLAYLFLSNIGIYIGRFLRFNSWDVLTNPRKLVAHLLAVFKERKHRRNILLFASLYTIFLLAFYLFLYSATAPAISVFDVVINRVLHQH